MKFYRAVYCASQKTIDGYNGFGFRTYTESMPRKYLTIIDDFHSVKTGSCPSLKTTPLFENRHLVLDMPKGYEFRKVIVDEGKEIYVLLRKVIVGFDWPFYESFTPKRTGNYVVDYLVFESLPTPDVFNLLYEIDDSFTFLPKNIVPSDDNMELKQLEVGDYPLLKAETFERIKGAPKITSQWVLELLWALHEGFIQNKPTIVKVPHQDAAVMVADLYSLLPAEVIAKNTFITNYQENGLEPNVELFVINEYYPHTIYEGQCIYSDFLSSQFINTTTRTLFESELSTWLQKNEIGKLKEFVTWIFSENYKKIHEKSEECIRAAYALTTKTLQYEALTNENICNFLAEQGLTDSDKQYIDSLIGIELNKLSDEDSFVSLAKQLEQIEKHIPIQNCITKYAPQVSQWLLETAQRFVTIWNRIDYTMLSKYFDSKVFESKESLLDEKELFPYWNKMYKLFYSKSKIEDKTTIADRMFRLNLERSIIESVMTELFDNDAQIAYYKNAILQKPSLVSDIWPLLQEKINTVISQRETLAVYYKAFWAEKTFIPIFLFEYKKGVYTKDYSSFSQILKPLITENETFAKQIKDNYIEDGILSHFSDKILTSEFSEESRTEAVNFFYDFLKPSSQGDFESWKNIYTVLAQDENSVSPQNVKTLYSIATKINAADFKKKFLPIYLESLTEDEFVADATLSDILQINEKNVIDWCCDQGRKQYKAKYIGAILQFKKVAYKDAQELLPQYGFTPEEQVEFNSAYYKKELRKEKIKNFFIKLFHKKESENIENTNSISQPTNSVESISEDTPNEFPKQ